DIDVKVDVHTAHAITELAGFEAAAGGATRAGDDLVHGSGRLRTGMGALYLGGAGVAGAAIAFGALAFGAKKSVGAFTESEVDARRQRLVIRAVGQCCSADADGRGEVAMSI